MKRPNILLIYTDQQRLDTISYLNKVDSSKKIAIKTPNIDALAEEGAFFTNYFVNNPVCAPSRMSFLTGLYPSQVGVGDNGYVFPNKHCHLGNILKPYGYTTAQIGKIHFEPHVKRNHEDPPLTFGFDTAIISDEPGCYNDAYTKWVESIDSSQVEKVRTSLPPAAYNYEKCNYSKQGREVHEPYSFEGSENFTHSQFVTEETIEFINQQNSNKPFFCIAGFYSPHPPLNPHNKYLQKVIRENIEKPKFSDNDEIMDFLKDLSEEDWIKIRAHYLALVCEIDECVGRIIESVNNNGFGDNTIVIFTSDHGEYLGDHGKVQKGMPGFDCIVNVPFIINGPTIQKQIVSELCEGVDFVPTILDFCGIQSPVNLHGKSLVNLLKGKETHHKDLVFCERFYNSKPAEYMIRTTKFKYCILDAKELLFDLEKDPYELEDISQNEQYQSILSKMRFFLLDKLRNIHKCTEQKDCEY